MDVPLRLPWAEAAQELELIVPVLVINEKIDVDANPVHMLRVDLLEVLDKPRLVNVLLEGVKIEVQGLVLAHDRAPEIKYLVEGVLLESGRADRLLKDKGMVLEELLAVVGGREELWDLWAAPDDEGLLRVGLVLVHHVLVLLVSILLYLILSNLEVCKLAQCFLEPFSFVTVGRDDDEVHFVLAKDLLKLSSVLSVPPRALLFPWSGLWSSPVRPASWLSWWDDVEEVFVGDKLSELVDNSHGGLKVAVVERVNDGTHHIQALSLLNEVLLDGSHSLVSLLAELPLLVLYLEVPGAHQLLIFLAAAVGHEVLGIFLKLELDLFLDTHQEGLLALVRLGALGAEDLEYLSPEEPPLRGVLGVLELLEHILEVLVADALVLVIVVDLDLKLDQA